MSGVMAKAGSLFLADDVVARDIARAPLKGKAHEKGAPE
jgi:hypothetical protein